MPSHGGEREKKKREKEREKEKEREGKMRGESCGLSFFSYKGTYPIMGIKPKYLPKSPSQKTITLGITASEYDFCGGHDSVHSTDYPLILFPKSLSLVLPSSHTTHFHGFRESSDGSQLCIIMLLLIISTINTHTHISIFFPT